VAIEDRSRSLHDEHAYTLRLHEALLAEDIDGADPDIEREIYRRLRSRAASHAFAARDLLLDTRPALKRASDPARRDSLQRVIARAERTRLRWNVLRRMLMSKTVADSLAPLYGEVYGEVLDRVDMRLRELDIELQALSQDTVLAALILPRWISLHVCLALGDNTTRWGLAIGSDSPFRSNNNKPELYGKAQSAFLGAARSLESRGEPPRLFETATTDGRIAETRAMVGTPYLTYGGEVAGIFGYRSLALATIQESFAREGTPDDVLHRLDLDRIEAQADEIARVLAEALEQDGLSLPPALGKNRWYGSVRFVNGKVKAPQAMATSPGSNVPDRPTPDVLYQQWFEGKGGLWYETGKSYGFDPFYTRMTDANGSYLA
jgi:hypothetical protein